MSFVTDIESYIRAGYPAIWILTQEEVKCTTDIQQHMSKITDDIGSFINDIFCWRSTSGWNSIDKFNPLKRSEMMNYPVNVLDEVLSMPESSIYVFYNFHPYINQPDTIQRLKDILPVCKLTGRYLIFISARVDLPSEIEKDIVLIEYDLPTRDDLRLVLNDISESADTKFENEDKVIESALGLTTQEAENAFSLALIKNAGFNKNAAETVMEQKMQIFKKSGLLEFYPAVSDGLQGVGGYGQLKTWLDKRKCAFLPKAREMFIEYPKGILMMGVPGTGKTLVGRSIAKEWDWPLVKMDIGRLFNSLIGESEANVRRALRMVEAVAPVVLLIDELDKGMAGLGSSGVGDSGVTARVLGTILTWMQDKKSPVFVAATVNRVNGLPPELLRKGRFDELFFFDLPKEKEREEIFKIHFKKRNISLEVDPNWITDSRDFSGAEIERIVEESLLTALSEDRIIDQYDIDEQIKQTVPLTVTMKEEIETLRGWAKDRAQEANTPVFSLDNSLYKRKIKK